MSNANPAAVEQVDAAALSTSAPEGCSTQAAASPSPQEVQLPSATSGGGLSPYPDPRVASYRCVPLFAERSTNQKEEEEEQEKEEKEEYSAGGGGWSLDVRRGARATVALRVWTPGARLSYLAVSIETLDIKVGVRFSHTPPWPELAAAVDSNNNSSDPHAAADAEPATSKDLVEPAGGEKQEEEAVGNIDSGAAAAAAAAVVEVAADARQESDVPQQPTKKAPKRVSRRPSKAMFVEPKDLVLVKSPGKPRGGGRGGSKSGAAGGSPETPSATTVLIDRTHDGDAERDTEGSGGGGGGGGLLSVPDAAGPGYFVIEFNNRFNILRSKRVSHIQWRIDGDHQAPCYAIGAVPVDVGDADGAAEGVAGTTTTGAGTTTTTSEEQRGDDAVPSTGAATQRELPLDEAQCVMFLRAAVELDPEMREVVMPGNILLRHDTETLLRFVRGAHLKAKRALANLKRHVVWRASRPTPGSEAVQTELSRGRIYVHGVTDSGHHLVVSEAGKFKTLAPGGADKTKQPPPPAKPEENAPAEVEKKAGAPGQADSAPEEKESSDTVGSCEPGANDNDGADDDDGDGEYDPEVVIQTHTEILDSFAEHDAAASWAARGRRVSSYVSLVAFTGTHGWPPVRTLRMLANVLGSNYPERTHSTVVYPVANWVRRTLNALLAVFVDPVTRGKIHFCSTLAEACQWLEVADPHSLPSSVSDPAAIEAFLREQEAAEAGEEGAAAAAAVQEATQASGGTGDEGALAALSPDLEDL